MRKLNYSRESKRLTAVEVFRRESYQWFSSHIRGLTARSCSLCVGGFLEQPGQPQNVTCAVQRVGVESAVIDKKSILKQLFHSYVG